MEKIFKLKIMEIAIEYTARKLPINWLITITFPRKHTLFETLWWKKEIKNNNNYIHFLEYWRFTWFELSQHLEVISLFTI